jgi:hypothetical protein
MELQSLDISRLMDMLVKYTLDYTKILNEGSSQDEYLKCKMAIKAIQSEIELRQNRGTDSPTLNSNATTSSDFSFEV